MPLWRCRWLYQFRKRHHPGSGLLPAAEGAPGVVGSKIHCSEHRFRVGVVVADPRPGEGPEHTKLLQTTFQRCGPHGVAVIGVEDQRLGARPADPLLQAGAADKLSGDLGIFPLGDIPCHDLAAPDIDHQRRGRATLPERWWAGR